MSLKKTPRVETFGRKKNKKTASIDAPKVKR